MEPASVVDLSLWAIIKIVLPAGIVSAVFTTAVSLFNEWRKDQRSARFFALQLAAHFEDFARSCSVALVANRVADVSSGHAGSWAPVPDLPPFPADDTSWKILDYKLVERCFAMRAKIRTVEHDVDQTAEMDDEQAHDLLMLSYRDIASDALKLAADLRDAFDFEEFAHSKDIKDGLDYGVGGIKDRRSA